MTRRGLLQACGLAPFGGLGALALAGCGAAGGTGAGGGADLVLADVARAAADTGSLQRTVTAVTSFTADLYQQVAAGAKGAGGGNLVCSPYSVATALGMTAQGARGATLAELLKALHVDGDSAAAATGFADGLNAIDLTLAARAGEYDQPDGTKGVIALDSANSLWGQRGITWQRPFLEVMARDFGTGMRQADYRTAAEEARTAINAWVAERTHARIPQLIMPGLLNALTRLVLVNALYFKAEWRQQFEEPMTRFGTFTRLDGSPVTVPLMHAEWSAHYRTGPGWAAATLPYVRDELAMTVVLPDRGRYAEVEKQLTGAWLARLLAPGAPGTQLTVTLPRWTARSQVNLTEALKSLGVRLAFTDAADLSGLTSDEQLQISAVVHEGWIGVDEAGTEAAAATAVVVRAASAVVGLKEFVVDRPFLYVIHDVATGLPLFVGRVSDPSQAAG